MASRYDKATPAKDTYFNTFVPLPLEQLTALGMSRKQDLEKNQMLLDRAYENAVNIKYAKESPFEETHYRNIVSGVTELAQKYASVDLTNPLEINNMRRELRTVADPALIKNMEATWAANEQKKALVADLKANGRWNEYLDDDPITSHNSATGSYNWLPEAYMGRKALFGPYFDNLPVDYKGIDNKTNMMVHGVRGEDINRIANERAAELASTPGGQQEIKIYKASHKPSDYEGKTNEQILNIVARDYGEKEIHDVYSALPEYMVKARAGKGLAAPSSLPLVTMSGATDTSEGYKKDLVKSKELQTGITKLDKEIESTEDPNLKTQFGAMKSELVNERNRIEKVAAQVRADAIPEYTAAKSKIMDQFYRESKVMGLDKTAADAVFKDISNEGDSLSWFNKRLQSVFNQSSEGLNTFAKTERARIAEGPLEIAKGPGYLWYKGLIAATKNDPNVSDEQRAEYQRRADEWGLKGRGDSDEFAQERIAVDAYRALEKLDRRTDRKVASKYDDKSYKNEQDLGFVLPGAEVSS
ncbi:MAG: hypothetical protein IMZ64_04355, partial [Bacteroidetes bacterium]|nr:hypothetical protein [Bacteroidota bacterium]